MGVIYFTNVYTLFALKSWLKSTISVQNEEEKGEEEEEEERERLTDDKNGSIPSTSGGFLLGGDQPCLLLTIINHNWCYGAIHGRRLVWGIWHSYWMIWDFQAYGSLYIYGKNTVCSLCVGNCMMQVWLIASPIGSD